MGKRGLSLVGLEATTVENLRGSLKQVTLRTKALNEPVLFCAPCNALLNYPDSTSSVGHVRGVLHKERVKNWEEKKRLKMQKLASK